MKLSILDFSIIPPNGDREQAIQNSLSLAQLAENNGFERIWYAEHHKNIAFVSCAPEILIPFIASKTSRIRVGSGAILLNQYSPFKVAETFTLLSQIFPGRIDLGVGRASGGSELDKVLQQKNSGDFFDANYLKVKKLYDWFYNKNHEGAESSTLKIYLKEGALEFWILGSGISSAILAGQLGVPYAFAGFINRKVCKTSLEAYNKTFAEYHPIKQKRTILAVHVVCAETDEEVQRLLSPLHAMFKFQEENIVKLLPSVEESIKLLKYLPEVNYNCEENTVPLYLAGTPLTLKAKIEKIAKQFSVEEIMLHDLITNHQSRLNSYKLIADAFDLKQAE